MTRDFEKERAVLRKSLAITTEKMLKDDDVEKHLEGYASPSSPTRRKRFIANQLEQQKVRLAEAIGRPVQMRWRMVLDSRNVPGFAAMNPDNCSEY